MPAGTRCTRLPVPGKHRRWHSPHQESPQPCHWCWLQPPAPAPLPPLRSLHPPGALQRLPCRDEMPAEMPNTCVPYSWGDEQGRQPFLLQLGPGALGCSRRQGSGKPKTCQVMLSHAAFFNTTVASVEFGGSHAGCTHPAPLPAPTSWDRGWERGPREKPRATAKQGRGARLNGSSLPRQAAAGSARGSWGCRQHGQMATSCPSSLRVSFTDLLSLSHCPSNDSGAELPLCRARHESHPNGILVTAGIAPGSQVCPALLPVPPTLAGSSGAGQQMENPVGHLWGRAWGRGDVLTRPRCLLGCGGAGAAAGGPWGSKVPSPAAVPGVPATGRSQAVHDPCRAQKAPFLMQKMPFSGRGPREALRVGSSSDVLGSSRHHVHLLPLSVPRLSGGCCLLFLSSTRMLARLAVGVTPADPFVRGDSAYRCLL